MRIMIAAATAALTCCLVGAGFWLGHQTSPAPSVSKLGRSRASESAVRRSIREEIETSAPQGPEGLAPYLDSLETRARRQGRVTALEVEPGIAMIRKFGGDGESISGFSDRMLRVAAELRGTNSTDKERP